MRKRRRWVRRGAVLLAGVAALGIMAEWIAGRVVERRFHEELAEQGWTLERSSALWNPWHGLILNHVKLRRGAESPVLGAERVAADFPLLGGAGGSQWRIGPGELVLRDSDGEIRLQEVDLKFDAHPGKIEVTKAEARHESLVVSTTGTILLESGKGPSRYEPDFSALRGTLAVLKMSSDKFRMTGSFSVDARGSGPPRWNADLKGDGTVTSWHGIPLRSVSAAAGMSSEQSTITATLVLPSGKSDFKVTKADWGISPYRIDGTLKDDAGRTDNFSGSYQPEANQWNLDSLSGPADLWQLAQDIPLVAAKLPEQLRCESFPIIRVEKARWTPEKGFAVKSVATSGKGSFTIDQGDREIQIEKISGGFAYDDSTWTLNGLSADVFDGRVSVSGRYKDPVLTAGKVTIEGISLAKLKEWSGEEATGKGLLFGSYSGSVDTGDKTLSGKGSLRLEDAPVIEVPLLDQVWQLFTAMIPGVKRASKGAFYADFVANSNLVEVPNFKATGGSLTVTAKGTVDLKRRRVDGVARGKLDGLPGLVTHPLSRLLEMEVSGPYDDIRVKPLGPPKLVSNAASATVGVAVETIEEAGKISGTVIVESIKLPFRWLQKKADEGAPR
ncbi:AsmA-like C-terminal region-containing protein [Luteolibacter arcticus]|uniref:AsmA-like C-terminal region-containing protein n=1 Tax=Luteolibacter arcticus TaxID=1581411 RepID=UPI002221BAF5|nr:AsmA-like C-terminal region-containing protein [Luteolibacter arcticus]